MVVSGCYKPTVNESETIKAAQHLWAVRGRGGGKTLGLMPDEIRLNWSGSGNFTSPLGEVGAQRRVRGYGLSWGSTPSPDLLTQIDLSPLGRGEPSSLAVDSTISHRAFAPIERS